MLKKDAFGEIWMKTDRTFGLPKLYFKMLMESPFTFATVESAVMSRMID